MNEPEQGRRVRKGKRRRMGDGRWKRAGGLTPSGVFANEARSAIQLESDVTKKVLL